MPETTRVRQGEELDIERLASYLADTLERGAGSLNIKQFPSGASNLTYLISIETDDYVLRRPPFGNTVKSAHDMRREFDVLSKLSTVYAPAPKPLLFCDDLSVIGSEFYLMERRNGLIIRGRSPEILERSPAYLEDAVVGVEEQNHIRREIEKGVAVGIGAEDRTGNIGQGAVCHVK